MLEQPIDHTVTDLDGEQFSLGVYRGLALLIVNITTEGPFAAQLAGLQYLSDAYLGRGLVVLGVPDADMGEQADGLAERLAARTPPVTFPVFQPLAAWGEDPSPLYRALTQFSARRGAIEEPFTKFLVDPDGYVVERWGSEIGAESEAIAEGVLDVLPTIC